MPGWSSRAPWFRDVYTLPASPIWMQSHLRFAWDFAESQVCEQYFWAQNSVTMQAEVMQLYPMYRHVYWYLNLSVCTDISGGKYKNCPILKEVLNSGTRVLKQIAAEGKNEGRGRKLKPLWRPLCQKILSGLKYEYCNCWRCTILQLCVLYTVLLSQLWYLLTKLIGKLHIVLSGCTFTSVMVLVHKIDLKTPYCIFKLQYSFLARAVTTFGQLWIIKYEARNVFREVAMIIPPKPDSKFSRVRHLGKCAYAWSY